MGDSPIPGVYWDTSQGESSGKGMGVVSGKFGLKALFNFSSSDKISNCDLISFSWSCILYANFLSPF